ncbi:hypothetical protein JRQ81_019127 [Phrynocephalus forsythii]|uniref:HTH CENPB-type domain-containing protein n=1 Tax=Phrynocephalus forsythii TaxID=171643 RepID=A0A9Q0XLA8_9SAUR|nr:hypothetical protein JRQ81_019127 [Phrynocephalus forsythii]
MIPLEDKQEIIRKHEGGMRVIELAREYGKSPSTIATILKNKDKITERGVAKQATRIMKQCPPVLEQVEKLLFIWVEEKQCAGDTVSKATICTKAKALHMDLLNQQPETSRAAEEFKASRGWFEKIKMRSEIYSMVRHGEAASSDLPATEDFTAEFLKIITAEGYLPEQVLNCDETGFFWKRMPKRT